MFDGAGATDPMPLTAAIVVGLILVVAGGLVVEVGRRARLGVLRRNWVVGIRTKRTLADDEAWDTVHRAAGRAMQVAGLGPVAVGIFLFTRPANGLGATLLVAAMFWLLIGVLVAARRGVSALD